MGKRAHFNIEPSRNIIFHSFIFSFMSVSKIYIFSYSCALAVSPVPRNLQCPFCTRRGRPPPPASPPSCCCWNALTGVLSRGRWLSFACRRGSTSKAAASQSSFIRVSFFLLRCVGWKHPRIGGGKGGTHAVWNVMGRGEWAC